MITQILIATGTPEPEQTSARAQAAAKVPIEDQVRDAIECIESGRNSSVEWIMLNKLYAELRKRKPTPRIKNLIQMIEPVLAKYGYHKVSK